MKYLSLIALLFAGPALAETSILWDIEIKNGDTVFQSTRFYTDRNTEDMPFITLESEDSALKGQGLQKEQSEMKFVLNSRGDKKLRYTTINYNLGALAAAKQGDKSSIGAVGSDNKITFFHLCDKKHSVVSIDKYSFHINCQEVK